MIVGKNLRYALEHWQLTEKDVLPYIKHFFVFCDNAPEIQTMFYYLRFLQRELKRYAKLKYQLLSFDEYMNDMYPKALDEKITCSASADD